jgi:Ca2+-binding EF-hand superfamily protein
MKRIALATLVGLGLAATAEAQQVPKPPGNDRTNQVSFEEVDRDKDGKLNREEGNAINGFDFSRADTDDSHTLTRQEFNAAMARSTARGDGNEGPLAGDRTEQVTFDQADKNRDGKIDRDEAEDIDGFDFTAADADDDRWLTRAEFQTAMAGSRPRG